MSMGTIVLPVPSPSRGEGGRADTRAATKRAAQMRAVVFILYLHHEDGAECPILGCRRKARLPVLPIQTDFDFSSVPLDGEHRAPFWAPVQRLVVVHHVADRLAVDRGDNVPRLQARNRCRGALVRNVPHHDADRTARDADLLTHLVIDVDHGHARPQVLCLGHLVLVVTRADLLLNTWPLTVAYH